jgi:hypothetical protein
MITIKFELESEIAIFTVIKFMSCYTGFFNVRRGWQSLNTGPRFYLRLIRRTGWLWMFTSRTTDGRPFKLSVPFLYPGFPRVRIRKIKDYDWAQHADKGKLSKCIIKNEEIQWFKIEQH